LNGTLEKLGLYDSGSNVSLINSNLVKIKGNLNPVNHGYLQTINGVKKTKDMIRIELTIFEITKKVDVYVIEDYDHDFIIDLDLIRQFRLVQNEDLAITQKPSMIQENGNINESNYKKKLTEEINFNEHIDRKKVEIKTDHLSMQQQAEINKLIEKYRAIFAKDKYDVGIVKNYEARIDLLVDKHCSKRPYRCTIQDKKEIEQQIPKLLEKNLIEESYSPFAAPVTLAFKKEENSKSRLCIDFRDLNRIVVPPETHPFPLIQDLIVATRNCKFYSTLDVNSAFWAIPLRIEDRMKTGFVTQEGHYQWTVLPFGFKNASVIFQRIMSSILKKHKLNKFAKNFIDDILIFSETFEEHVNHLEQLLDAISHEGFRLKLIKCTFAANSVKYLGHIIGNNNVKPLRDNLIAIKEFPVPKTQKSVREFLGKANFYHEYIPKRMIVLDPLYKLLRKDQKFIWTEECQRSFEKVKDILCSQPALEIYDLPINIYTDASLQGIGAIFKQVQQDGKEKTVAYFSKKLHEYQKRKKAIYLECLAIKEAVQHWQFWLMGKRFTVYSDHKPLQNLNVKSRPDEELGDLTYYLSQYDFTVKYAPGKDNIEADCLSRNPVLDPNNNEDEQLKIVNLIYLKDIILDQEENKEIQEKKIH